MDEHYLEEAVDRTRRALRSADSGTGETRETGDA